MRQLVAHIATIAIAVLLLTGAALFAWARASQVTLTTEAAVLDAHLPARSPEEGATFRWQALGADAYTRNCRTCHLADGSGWDQYPSLQRTAALAAAPGGRDYLVDLHLYGLASDRWRAPMPPMGHLHDVELAAVLNHVQTALSDGPADDAALFRPEDIAARRGRDLRPGDVDAGRPTAGR